MASKHSLYTYSLPLYRSLARLTHTDLHSATKQEDIASDTNHCKYICVICTYTFSCIYMYGTHTRVPRMCRPRKAHALLLHACTFVCFYLLHHEHVRKHTSYVCMYTRFFIHAHTTHGVTCTQLHLTRYLHCHRSTNFFSVFRFETRIPSFKRPMIFFKLRPRFNKATTLLRVSRHS